jgi:hypothetical protein
MSDTGVDAHLDMVRQGEAMAIRAYVASAPPRRLRWKLVTISRSAGGTSDVSQSGTTDGTSDIPVSVTSVSPNSQGSVVLTVYDGDLEVAREAVELGEPAAR